MQELNKVFLMGRLGNDPEIQRSQKGSPYARLSVATHRKRKGLEGEEATQTSWHTVFVWGKQGEICATFLKKGAPVLVEGFLSSYSVQNGKGDPQWKSSITADRVSFLSPKATNSVEHKFDS